MRTERRVEPHRQVHHLMRWFLLAWDLGRSDWRVFRLDRVHDLRRTNQHFTRRQLPAGSALEYLRQGLRRDRRPVTVEVSAPAVQVLEEFAYDDVEVAEIGPARTRLTMAVDSWQRLVRGLAHLDVAFAVRSTSELATFGRRLLAAVPDASGPV